MPEYDENFKSRLPKIGLYEDQVQKLNKKTLAAFIGFLSKRGKSRALDEALKTMDWKDTDEHIFEKIKAILNPPKANQQYQRINQTLKDMVGRAMSRYSAFAELVREINNSGKAEIDLVGKTIADIGSGDGIIAKTIAKEFNVKRIDMFEPYVPENKQLKAIGFDSNFFVNSFEKVQAKPMYDAIFVITTFHHLQNPLEVAEEIRKHLIPGGYLFVREHDADSEQKKMFLDCQEKAYSLSLTNEDTYEKFKNGSHPKEAYYSLKDLKSLVRMRLIGRKKEVNYEINGFANFYIFHFVK